MLNPNSRQFCEVSCFASFGSSFRESRLASVRTQFMRVIPKHLVSLPGETPSHEESSVLHSCNQGWQGSQIIELHPLFVLPFPRSRSKNIANRLLHSKSFVGPASPPRQT